jgi:hypothetical protein
MNYETSEQHRSFMGADYDPTPVAAGAGPARSFAHNAKTAAHWES